MYRIVSYRNVNFEALVQKHQRRVPKQTGKFLTVLRMFPPLATHSEEQ